MQAQQPKSLNIDWETAEKNNLVGLPVDHYVLCHSDVDLPTGFYCSQGVKMFSVDTQDYEFRLDDYPKDLVVVIAKN